MDENSPNEEAMSDEAKIAMKKGLIIYYNCWQCMVIIIENFNG